MCRVLGVSTSGYYAWRSRQPSAKEVSDSALMARIKAIHAWSDGTYGAPRIRAELADEGWRVSPKRVARLMRQTGLRGVCRRRWIITTRRNSDHVKRPDLVNRQFTASQPNTLYVVDITYIPTGTATLYLAVVLDVFSRRIVGWAMATDMKTRLVLDALEMALTQRRPEGVIHHSDQGAQYTSIAFGERCRKAGVRPSMGSVGDCYDNSMAESFFATLECELLDRSDSPRRQRRSRRSSRSSKGGTTHIAGTRRLAMPVLYSSSISMRQPQAKAVYRPLNRGNSRHPRLGQARTRALRPQVLAAQGRPRLAPVVGQGCFFSPCPSNLTPEG